VKTTCGILSGLDVEFGEKPVFFLVCDLLRPDVSCSFLRIVRPATTPTNLMQFRKAKTPEFREIPTSLVSQGIAKQKTKKKLRPQRGSELRESFCTRPHHVSALSPSRSTDLVPKIGRPTS
jgi:hypothetical protein